MIRVLVFPAGEINSIELHDALSTCVNIEVWGASSIERHGKYVFENYISNLPMINDSNFINEFNSIIQKHNIDIIFATHDTVIDFLIKNQHLINAKVAGGDIFTVDICRSKKKTYNLFKDNDFVPITYSKPYDLIQYPVFAKPDQGQGAVGTKKIDNINEFTNIDDSYVICEYLPGREYTVDCITDKDGILRGAFPRTRDRIMSGVAVAGKTLPQNKQITQIAEIINSKLHFKGMWYFQLKEDNNGKLKLLEISARASGTMCLTRMRGVNLPLLTAYTMMDYRIDVQENNIEVVMDRTLISRYNINCDFNVAYLDFDDTVVVREKINKNILRFIYQCNEKDIDVILITKHNKNIENSLEKYKIHKYLFKKIIVLNDNENKSDYINPERAVFIDNMYKERKNVYDRYKIPVFDVDTIEVLLDWRY